MGCSSTKDLSLVIAPTVEKRELVTIPTDVSHFDREKRCVENCIVVYLTKPSSIRAQRSVTEQLRRIVCTLKTFTDPDECVTFIQNIQDEKIFLIVSSEMDIFVERFHHLAQLEKVYVFDVSSGGMKIADLCEQLRQDVEHCELDLVGVSAVIAEASKTSTSAKQTALFLYAQLIKEILLHFKFENEAKRVFLEFCRAHYAGDDDQLRAIDDFESSYRPQKALYWLTNSCFVSRILHRAQRTQEIDIMYKMGFLIKHIHIQLTILHEKIALVKQNPLIVYRGKSMSSDEFDTLLRNNCDGLLSFSNFITASTDKNLAVDFIRRRNATHPEMTVVLFEIRIDKTIRNITNPFALLGNLDPDVEWKKGEICFTLGTVFRIESVEQAIDSSLVTWTVKLTPIDDNDQQLYRLLAPLRISDVLANPLSHMGKLLIEMGEYNRAEQFYLKILVDPSVCSQPRRLARVHNGLGAIFTFKGDYSKALEHYQIVLDVSLSYLQPEHSDLAPIYSTIGTSYFNRGDYALALDSYKRAAELVENNTQSPDQQFIDDLHNRITKTRQLLELNM